MPAGAIQFVADASQLKKESSDAAKSVASVAASAEDARKRIVESYQAQIAAAKESGASVSQLESITRRSAQSLASVTEESAHRYIAAIDRMEARTRSFNAARSTLTSATVQQPVSQFTFGGFTEDAEGAREAAAAIDAVGEAHSRGVSPAVQFGSVIRGLEGNFGRNIRAAEVFGSTLGFLGPVVEAAFPIVGAVTLGFALFEMGKHAYEAWQNVVNLKSAIEGLNQLQISTDADAKRDQNAVESATEAILEKTAGRSASLSQRYNYQSGQGVDLSSFFYSDAFKKLPDDVKGNFEATYKSIAPADIPARLKSITDTVNGLKQAISDVQNHNVSAFNLPSFAGATPNTTRDPEKYYQAQLAAAQQIQTRLSGANDVRTANLQQIQTDQSAAQKEEAQKGAQKALQAQRKAAEQQRQQWADEFAAWEASGQRSEIEIANWWADKAVSYAKGADNFNEAMRRANEETVKVLADTAKQTAEYQKTIGEMSQDQAAKIANPDLSQVNRDAHSYAGYFKNLNAISSAKQQNGYSLEQATIQQKLANGEINRAQAAYATATLHAKEYADALAAINAQQDALDNNSHISDAERKKQQSDIDLQRTQLSGKQSVQAVQDSAATAADTWSTQFQQANRRWVTDLNGQLSNLITGQKTNWASFFNSIASSLANIGLNLGEQAIFGKGGLSGAIGGNAGGIFSTLFSGRAVGGNVDADSTYLVGERGPELLTLGSTSGRITPNSQLGGGDTHYYSIDARGANDPATVDAAVRRAIAAAAPSIVAASVSTVSERNRRTPSTARKY